MKYLQISGKGNGRKVDQLLEEDVFTGFRWAAFNTPESFDVSVDTTQDAVKARIEELLRRSGITDFTSTFVEESGDVFVNSHETDDDE